MAGYVRIGDRLERVDFELPPRPRRPYRRKGGHGGARPRSSRVWQGEERARRFKWFERWCKGESASVIAESADTGRGKVLHAINVILEGKYPDV